MVSEARPTRWGDREARDRDIKRAAAAVIAENGYTGLTMRAVARGAGVSLGLIYSYYSSKDELFVQLFAERLERFHAEIVGICENTAVDTTDALVLMTMNYTDVYRDFGKSADAFLQDAKATAEGSKTARRLVSAALDLHVAIWTAFTRLEPRLHEYPQERRDAAIQLVWITIRGLAEHANSPRAALAKVPIREFVRFSCSTLLSGLLKDLDEKRD